MAYNYVIGPGGQPMILMQPLMQVQTHPHVQQMPPPQQPQPLQPPKLPDYMSEEKLQDKGEKTSKIDEQIFLA